MPNDDSQINQINIVGEKDREVAISPEDQRKNRKLIFAGRLASGLWLGLGLVVGYHCLITYQLSQILITTNNNEETEKIEKAIQLNKETAQTIYTFITPLAAAVTTFFFGNASSNSDS